VLPILYPFALTTHSSSEVESNGQFGAWRNGLDQLFIFGCHIENQILRSRLQAGPGVFAMFAHCPHREIRGLVFAREVGVAWLRNHIGWMKEHFRLVAHICGGLDT